MTRPAPPLTSPASRRGPRRRVAKSAAAPAPHAGCARRLADRFGISIAPRSNARRRLLWFPARGSLPLRCRRNPRYGIDTFAAARIPPRGQASPETDHRHTIVALHLIKLCVGCDSVEELDDWIREKLKDRKKRGLSREHMHRTRMVPKRADELRDGGSLYWVIRGEVDVSATAPRRAAIRRQGRHRPLPSGAGAEARSGRAATLARVPGLALSRGTRTCRATSTAPRPVPRTCRKPCVASSGSLGSCDAAVVTWRRRPQAAACHRSSSMCYELKPRRRRASRPRSDSSGSANRNGRRRVSRRSDVGGNRCNVDTSRSDLPPPACSHSRQRMRARKRWSRSA